MSEQRGWYESRLVLVLSKTWVAFGALAERPQNEYYYLGALFGDDTLTIIRDLEPGEVERLDDFRTGIARHNAAIAAGKPGSGKLNDLQIEAERKRSAMKRGDPSSVLFRSPNASASTPATKR